MSSVRGSAPLSCQPRSCPISTDWHTGCFWPTDAQYMIIPHICHFFYTDRIFENQILHPKKRLKAPKTLKMSLKKSNICIFFHSIWKNLHLTKFFYTDMSVVSVTNMRYDFTVRLTAGLHKLWYPGIRDTSTWSKFGAHGEHGDVFLFSNLGAL